MNYADGVLDGLALALEICEDGSSRRRHADRIRQKITTINLIKEQSQVDTAHQSGDNRATK